MNALLTWLRELGLERYGAVLADNDVDLNALRLLTDADLVSLGVSLGHRKVLLKAIAELNASASPSPSPAPGEQGPFEKSSDQSATTAEGERRQLTVLFCDMVGFTELANRVDPEVLQRIIRSYEDACAVCITRYEGYVFQRLGDGIVAFFGYPLAHEGEAERAIHAGLAIIDSLSRLDLPDLGHLQVRIGVATGLVVVSSAQKGAVGETMNLASRLQGIAPVGSIVISERVRQLAGGRFIYDNLGEQTLKGIARPTNAFRVLGVSEIASRFEAATQEGLTPMVGREQEIRLLLDRWTQAQDGEGQAVLLSGEPGLGKSRILNELRERLENQGAGTLAFQCSPYYTNSPFYPSIDNLERAVNFGREESAESKLDKLEALVVTHYGRPKEDVRFIAAMLSVPTDVRYGPITITPQQFKDETLRALVELTEAAARKQRTVMLFEDAHWADPTSLELLDLLIDLVKSFPLLIVLTHRPEFQNRWGSHGHVTALNLPKLTKAQSSAIANELAKNKALPGNLLEQILTRTDGVPLFVEELTKAILESKDIQEKEGRYEYAGDVATITIPATLRDSLMARLDRNQAVKEIAQIGAAIGREFSYELIQAIAPKTNAELDHALQQLTASGLAFRRGTPPEAQYTFKHALVQDVAYDSLLKSRRQELHEQVALALESMYAGRLEEGCELLAYHYARSLDAKKAVEYLDMANRKAIRINAMVEAKGYFIEAMRLLDTLSPTPENHRRRIALIARQILVFLLLFALSEYYEYLTRFAPLARDIGDPGLLGGYYGAMTMTECCFGDLERAIETGQQAADLCRAGRNFQDLTEVYASLGWSYVHYGNFEAALALEDGLEQNVQRSFDFQWYSYALGALTAAGALRGDFERAITFGKKEFRIAEEFGDRSAMSHAAWTTSWAYLYRGDSAQALQAAERAVELAPTIATKSWADGSLGMAHCRAGNPERAIEILAPLVPGYRGARFRLSECFTTFLGEAYWRAGKGEQARQTLQELLGIIEPCGMRAWMGTAHRLLGEITELTHPAQATVHFERSLVLLEETGAQPELAFALASYGSFHRRQGRTAEAQQSLHRALTISERLGILDLPDKMRKALAESRQA
jgi:class 3 adenylate cyclase/tetratricopeptide (TPR) repeat protein